MRRLLAATSGVEQPSLDEQPVRRRRTRKAKAAEETTAAAEGDVDAVADSDVPDNRFIDLVDLLPPLPSKGEFDVSTIKKSVYFFS